MNVLYSIGNHMGLRKWLIFFRGQQDTSLSYTNVIKVYLMLKEIFGISFYIQKKNIDTSLRNAYLLFAVGAENVMCNKIYDSSNSLLLFARSFNIPKVFCIYKMKWEKCVTKCLHNTRGGSLPKKKKNIYYSNSYITFT